MGFGNSSYLKIHFLTTHLVRQLKNISWFSREWASNFGKDLKQMSFENLGEEPPDQAKIERVREFPIDFKKAAEFELVILEQMESGKSKSFSSEVCTFLLLVLEGNLRPV